MLILTRKLGEALMIGDNVEVTILDVIETQVRLGIAAPRHIAVDRKEIRIRKDAGRPAPRSQKRVIQPEIRRKAVPRIILRRRLIIENPLG